MGTPGKLQEELFAWFCAHLGGPLEAARRVGMEQGAAVEAAQKTRVRDKVQGHEKALEARARSVAVRALLRLCTYSGQDGVKLAVRGGSLTREELDGLDLCGVSSFKYTPDGVCEVKFFDPARAAGLLLEMGQTQAGGAEGFYQALRESAALLRVGEAREAEEDHAAG